MASRQLVVVDVESTGLVPQSHTPLEVAAINLETGEELHFVPFLSARDILNAQPDALQINRYYERGVWRHQLPQAETKLRYAALFEMLRGNTFGGANPRFDAEILRYGFARAHAVASTDPLAEPHINLPDETWHYRLSDIQSYYCGVMGTDPAQPPSLTTILGELDINNPNEHSAYADAEATCQAFRALQAYRERINPTTPQEALAR